MKKLLALILILALALPALALADQDPIVGNWYLYIDIPNSPLSSSMPDFTKLVLILTFEESGKIIWSELDYKGTQVEVNQPQVGGEWKKDDKDYQVSIIAVGTEKAFFEDDLLYVAAFDTSLYFGFRKMIPLDFYYNIYRK